MEKIDTLIVVLFSTRVDTYINIICHCYREYNISRVVLAFFASKDAPIQNAEAASDFYLNIMNRISGLSKGFYSQGNDVSIDLEFVSSAPQIQREKKHLYGSVYNALVGNAFKEDLSHSNLRQELTDIIRKYGGYGRCILDISTLDKKLSIELFMTCVAIGMKNVFTFSLEDINRDNPQFNLYHNLTTDKYSYSRLTDLASVSTSLRGLIRVRPISVWIAVSILASVIFVILSLLLGPDNTLFLVFGGIAGTIGLVGQIYTFFQAK